MSERLPNYQEQDRSPEVEKRPEASAETRQERSTEHHEAAESTKNIEALHHKIEHEAKRSEQVRVGEENKRDNHQYYVTKDLKNISFKRTLARTRKHLAAPDKVLSKVIHQPIVDGLSRVGEKTVARPIGLLSGSVFAFAGTTFTFYMAKHYGFRYNLLLFALLFIGGFIAGTLLEVGVGLLKRLSHK